jgi:uncharacterized protein
VAEDRDDGTRSPVQMADRTPIDRAGLEVLERGECLRLLASVSVGRIAISVRALPLILPVRFVVDGDSILIRTHPGTTLEAATRGAVVAFEAEGANSPDLLDWSVLVTGVARHLTEAEHRVRGEALGLPRWSADEQDRIVLISTDHVSGRRSVPSSKPDAGRPPV